VKNGCPFDRDEKFPPKSENVALQKMGDSLELQIECNVPNFVSPSGKWKLENLKSLSVLFGKNGSGKSHGLRGIYNNAHSKFHYCNPEKAGSFNYEPNIFESELSSARTQGRTENLNPNYFQQVVTRLQVFFAKRGRWVNGKPPISHLELQDMLRTLLPDYEIELLDDKPYVKLSANINLNQLSSGERHILGVGLDIVTVCGIWKLDGQGTEGRKLLIDEPDAHLHPDIHQNFALFLKDIVRIFNVQVLLATHSTTLLAALGHYFGEDLGVIFCRKGTERQIAVPFSKVHKDLATILGGHALMGPLFSIPLLLVEGDDDYRIWSQVPRHHRFSFSVLPCNGEEIFDHQKKLESIFISITGSSTQKSGFALIDGDKPMPQVSQERIEYLRLNCRESENLYFTLDVLQSFGMTWEAAKAKVKAEAHKFGQKAEKLSQIESWNMQKDDLKNIVNEVAEILDPKKLHWTVRVGKVIGAGAFGNEMRNFLGEKICEKILT